MGRPGTRSPRPLHTLGKGRGRGDGDAANGCAATRSPRPLRTHGKVRGVGDGDAAIGFAYAVRLRGLFLWITTNVFL